jgi:hypothetical protein
MAEAMTVELGTRSLLFEIPKEPVSYFSGQLGFYPALTLIFLKRAEQVSRGFRKATSSWPLAMTAYLMGIFYRIFLITLKGGANAIFNYKFYADALGRGLIWICFFPDRFNGKTPFRTGYANGNRYS